MVAQGASPMMGEDCLALQHPCMEASWSFLLHHQRSKQVPRARAVHGTHVCYHAESPSPAVTYLQGMGDEPPALCLVGLMEALLPSSKPTPKTALMGVSLWDLFRGYLHPPS